MGHLSIRDDELALKTIYEDRFIARAAGGRWDKVEKIWLFPLTLAAIERLRRAFDGNLSLEDGMEEWCVRLRSEIEKAQVIKCGDETTDYMSTTEPFKHQRSGTGFLLSMRRCFLWDEQGLGKTKEAIDAAAQRMRNFQISTCLIICPASIKFQWQAQVLQHSSFGEQTHVAHGSPKRRKELYERIAKSGGFLIMSYDTARLDAEDLAPIMPGQMLVLDEHQAIKNSQALRSKAILGLARAASYVVAMTGTPIWNNPADLWFPSQIVAAGALPTSFFAFQQRYCIMGGFQGKKIIGFRHLDEIRDALEPYSLRREKKDCLDLPDKIRSEIPLALSKPEQKAYDDMKEKLAVWLKNEPMISVRAALAKITKLRQITGGFIYDEEGDARWIGNTKINAVKDLLEMHSDKKVIIWSCYRAPLARMQDEFAEWNPVTITGGHSNVQREAARRRFQEDKDCRLFLGQIQSGGVGLDLPAATAHIFYDLDWNASVMVQAEDRSHRIGQTESLSLVQLIVPDSIDTYIQKGLRRKEGWAGTVLEALSPAGLRDVIGHL